MFSKVQGAEIGPRAKYIRMALTAEVLLSNQSLTFVLSYKNHFELTFPLLSLQRIEYCPAKPIIWP